MKRARQIGLGILAAVSFAVAASAYAQPGEGRHKGSAGVPHAHDAGQGQHGAMQARMAQRMAQHQGAQAGGEHGGMGCGPSKGQQSGAEGEHKH